MRKRLNVKLISESANAKVSEFTNAHTSKCANTHESEHANAHTSKHANACTNEPVNARMRITALLNLITALIYPYNCPCPPAKLWCRCPALTHFFTGSLPAEHRVPLTMWDP